MHKKLIKYFSRFSTFTAAELQLLEESIDIRYFTKDAVIVKEGQRNNDTFFVLEGLIRQYKLIDGEEITTNFFPEEHWIISLADFAKDTLATEYLVCAEDTAVVVGNEQKAQVLFREFPRFETISRAVIETVFAEERKKTSTYFSDTPEERYIRLLNTTPDILQRIPQYQLASYIGVKPESLSRIRKRLFLKSKT